MKITFGVLAHVDAGKTTFSEQLLYRAGVIKKPGRVDERTSSLDTNPIEKERGITVYSGQACFEMHGSRYCLLDTPGHVDFSAEMERVLSVLDYAVLVISGTDGVQSHTETVYNLLLRYRIPVFFFINKMDRDTASKERALADLKTRLDAKSLDLAGSPRSSLAEDIAAGEEELMQKYLDQTACEQDYIESLKRQIQNQEIMPVFFGSALYGTGIGEFLNAFCLLAETRYEEKETLPFSGRVFQVRYEGKERITCLKVLTGRLKVKDAIGEEKVDQLKLPGAGVRKLPCTEASAGDIAFLSGLSSVLPGDGIGSGTDRIEFRTSPVLRAKVNFGDSIPSSEVLKIFRILSAEDPTLAPEWDELAQTLHIGIMGKIQLEILKSVLSDRFGLPVTFSPPEVLYKETVADEVTGCGHFEPLRHYAEVILRIAPAERGSGIRFESECHVDVLPANYQSLVRTHVMEKVHRGVLTGSPLTDVTITLINGRHHLKHTEGGDFREAVYRAVRQGLKNAESILLEPFYEFTITAPEQYAGRLMSDIRRLSGSFGLPLIQNGRALIRGKGPVSEFADYAMQLADITRGQASVSFSSSGYEPCHNTEEVVTARAYRPDADTDNPSCSVFCAKGSSFVVNWDEAEQYMHCLG